MVTIVENGGNDIYKIYIGFDGSISVKVLCRFDGIGSIPRLIEVRVKILVGKIMRTGSVPYNGEFEG